MHCDFEDGLALWDALAEQGVCPVGVETYANSRRVEKSMRLQNADLLTEYNLLEADLERPKVKPADFHGKAAYVAAREKPHQCAYLCTLVMESNIDAKGVARYPVGICPIIRGFGRGTGRRARQALLPFHHCLWAEHWKEHRTGLSALRVL